MPEHAYLQWPVFRRSVVAAFQRSLTQYEDNGALKQYATGVVTHTVEYDARQRTRRITAGAHLDLTYTYDAASQVETITDTRPGMTQAFGYDALGRLTSALGPYGYAGWDYDATGNRIWEKRGSGHTAASTTTYNYNAATQRLTSTSGATPETFTYDNLGRLTTDGRGTYGYNARSLLTSVTRPGLSASYQYDPAGLRIARTVNTQASLTIRGASGEVLSEFRAACGTPVWARDVITAGGRVLGAVKATTTRPTVAATAATGTVVETAGSRQVGIQLTTPGGTPLPCAVTVAYEVTPGTATVGQDYSRVGGTVTFAAGALSGNVQNVAVPILNDTSNEPIETFTLLLSDAIGADIASPAGQVVTITDDDIGPAMAVETPLHLATVKTPFTITGWAIDESSPTGTGVNLIHVYATPSGGSATFLGAATGGGARPDIATLYGASRFTPSGFTYTAALAPGTYTITVYARNATTGVFNQAQAITVTVAPANPLMALETPASGWELAQPFLLQGWAVDTGSSTGTGVDQVEVRVYAHPGGALVHQTPATIGLARADVAQQHGPQFTNSGYQWQVRGLAPGWYRFEVRARSTVTGTWQARDVTPVRAAANPVMYVDAPSSGGIVNQSFTLAGWAADVAAATGTGVNTIHVWAYPSGGAPAVWVGTPTYGSARYDVGGAYGPQFVPSGFSMTATLPSGSYQLVTYAFSTVEGTFNQAFSVPITVATSQPLASIDQPAASATVGQPFGITGWAIDVGSPPNPGSTGVDAVHVYAVANGGAGASTFVGIATYGGARPDVAAAYGHSRFTNSGWGITASGLAPGTYRLDVYVHSTVPSVGGWTLYSRVVTVQ